jgi:hypothetical protein
MFKSSESIKLKNVHGLPESEVEVEVLLAENLPDAIQDAGGEDALVEVYNDAKQNRAKTNGRNTYRNAPAGTVLDELITRVKSAVANFSFQGSRDLGVKKKAEKFDHLKSMLERGEELSREQLLQLLSR